MQNVQHIRVVKSVDLKWFTNELALVTRELQNKGWAVEYQYQQSVIEQEEELAFSCLVIARGEQYEPEQTSTTSGTPTPGTDTPTD